MGNLKEEAEAYVPGAKTKNITELPEVSVDFAVVDDSFEADDIDAAGKPIKKVVDIKVIEVNGEQYRVPKSVLEQLKIQLAENPKLKRFKVTSTGTGMSTKYTVIPLM